MSVLVGSANQDNFRARDDSQGLNTNSFTQTLNSNFSQAPNLAFRIRFDIEGSGSSANNFDLQFMYSYNGGSYTVITSSSSPIKLTASSQFSDRAICSSQLLTSNTTFTAGQALTSSTTTTVNIGWTAGVVSEFEGCFMIIGSAVNVGDTISIQMYSSSGTALGSYAQTPTITVLATPQVATTAWLKQ